MSDVKKYYYMRLKENFFDSEEMVLLESMQDGIQYSNILIKMYLKSLKSEGRLMFKDTIPYNPQMIATITRHQVGTVEKALNTFAELGLIEVLSDGAIYMNDIELFIGKTSTEGERKKLARMKIEQQKLEIGTNSGQMSDVHPPELELEKEIKLELELKKEKPMLDKPSVTELDVELELEFDYFYKMYPKKVERKRALPLYKKARKKYSEEHIINGLLNYIDWIKLNGTENKYIKGPAVYLNGENFNDEYDFSSIKQNKNKSWGEILNDRRANGSDSRRDIHTLPELLG